MKDFAMLFPGQGSQSIGMMESFKKHKIIQDTFAEASDYLREDLWKLALESNEKINQTEYTQPLLLISGVALWRAWFSETGSLPSITAGHSLGEYTALVIAQSLTFQSAVYLVRHRAELMQNATAKGVGSMAAILGLENTVIDDICQLAKDDEIVEPANLNSPEQTVIAGHTEAVKRAMELAKQKGAKRCIELNVSVPSHCSLMLSAGQKLADYLIEVEIKMPNIPVIHNADVETYSDSKMIKQNLVRQLYSRVRWVETIQKIKGQGITNLVECGPGKVLTGLTKRIESSMIAFSLGEEKSFYEAVEWMNG